MRSVRGARVVCLFGAALVAGVAGACRSDIESESLGVLARLSPATISNGDAWALFDRSMATGYQPDGRPVTIDLGGSVPLAAVKVRGASPYRLEVRSPGGSSLGFATIDLSTLSPGWHTFASTSATSTAAVELTFHANGAPAAIPELELWTVASDAPAARPDLSVRTATDHVVPFAATESSQQIDPGTCAAYKVELTRPPALFRRMHLAYESVGLFRPFAIERSINGRAAIGGSWQRANAPVTHTFVEEIDADGLTFGKNTVRFCVPAGATAAVTLTDVRVVGELDRGDDHVAKVTVGERDGAAAMDGRADTTLALAPGERMRLDLYRLVAPDAIVIDGAVGIARIDCIGKDGAATALEFEDIGGVLRLQGGESACAALTLEAQSATSIADIRVVGSGAAERVDWPQIVVTSAAEHFGTLAWVGGFVARPPVMSGSVRVDVAAHSGDRTTGEFGGVIRRTTNVAAAWVVDVAAHLPDGSQQSIKVVLAADRAADLAVQGDAVADVATDANDEAADAARFGALDAVKAGNATMLSDTKIRLGTHAGIDIPAGAVLRSTQIQARRLDRTTLPPLDPGMINVTAPQGQGYEFLPHGQRFAKSAEVIVPFDPRLIPDGMTADDVHTFFYDDTTRRWRKLRRNSIDLGEHVLRSGTDHFTIMINAVLAVPTSPTPLSFDPTALASIAAASPAAGIDLIEPPTANSMGDARTGLPIRLPAGRGAYSPSLAIGYSSGGDNGWLGVGWDLSISRIEIDTRWGVPTYADGEEPRYLIDGAQLVPTLELEGPTCLGGRRYHARVEGAFTHVLRCGTSASNYYWMVTDRNGTKFMYGRDSSGTTANASLASYRQRPCGAPPCGNGIYRWHLREVTDTYGNKTMFTYQVDNVAGAEPSREVYPQRIDYTSHPTKAAAYSVELILDNNGRPDKLVNARSGFKRMTRKLLRRVHVRFQGGVIREYVLTYSQGQFQKTLLSSARVYGIGGCAASSNAFALPTCAGEYHEHTFKYHSDAEGFGNLTRLCAEESGQTCTATPHTNTLTKGKTTTWAGGLSVGVDFGGYVTATAGVSGSMGDRYERVGMYDVNGDGLVDQLYHDGSTNPPRVLYNDGHSFNETPPTTVQGLSELGLDESLGWGVDATVGVKASGFGASASGGFSNSTSRAKRIFTDLDGDGFIDFLDATGTSLSSKPVPGGQKFDSIAYEAIKQIDPMEDPLLDQFEDEIEERAIPAGPTIQWVAPYSGTVTISGHVMIGEQVSTDGVSVGLYHNDQLLAGATLVAPHAALPLSRTLQVAAGDALYVYGATGVEGKSGNVLLDVFGFPRRWTVQYTSVCTNRTCTQTVPAQPGWDPTGNSPFLFQGYQLRVVGQPVRVPYAGTVRVRGIVEKLRSAAPLRYCLQRFPAAAARTDWSCSDSSSPGTNVSGTISTDQDVVQSFAHVWNVPVTAGDQLVLRVESDYSFDPYSVSFNEGNQQRRLQYIEACLPNDQGTCTMTTGPEATGIVLDHEAFGFFAAPVSSPRAGAPPIPFVAEIAGTYVVYPFSNPLGNGVPITVAFRTDQKGTLKSPAPFACTTSCAPSPNTINLAPGESLSIEVTADFYEGDPFTTHVTLVSGGLVYQVPLIFREKHARPITSMLPFAGGYRGWNATFWNEREAFAPTALLAKYEDLYALPGCAPPPAQPSDTQLCADSIDQVARTAIRPVPAFDGTALTMGARAWVAPSSSAFIVPEQEIMHAAGIGGVGGVSPNPETATPGGGLFDQDYVRLSGTRSYYAGAGVTVSDDLPVIPGLLGGGLNVTVTRSTTKTSTDIVDMTGDGIPDVISGKSVYQGAIGSGITSPKLGFALDNLRQRNGTDYHMASSINASIAVTTPSGRRRMEWAQRSNSDFGIGTSVGLSVGRAQTTDDLVDINGDGLPDVVQRRGTQISVRYNLGTEFGAWETIGAVASGLNVPIDGFQNFEINTSVFNDVLDTTKDALTHETTLTENKTYSLDLVFVKASKTTRKTSSRATRMLADLNGDGLPDLLLKKSGQPIKVQYNRGIDFGPVRTWTGPPWGLVSTPMELSPTFDSKFDSLTVSGTNALTGADVLAATSTQESTTWAGGVSVKIYGPLVASGNVSHSTDEDTFELGLLDVTGDGHVDHVLRRKQGNDASTLHIKPNLVSDRSNRLIEVKRPLGGTIKLTYGVVGNTVDMPHRRSVLASVEVDDGVDLGADFASPNMSSSFTYEGGFFDRFEKQFLGFAKVTTQRPDDGTLEQLYENKSFVLHGLLKQETRTDSAAAVLHKRVLTYQLYDVTGPLGVLSAHPACVSALHELQKRIPNNGACTPKFPALIQDDDIRGEIGTTATKTWRQRALSFDRFGNVLKSDDTGDGAVLTDSTYAAVTYQNDTAKWILGRPKSLVVRSNIPTGPIRRLRTGTYYPEGTVRDISVETGSGVATTQFQYDAYGNRERIETPPNANGETQTYTVGFDATTATYPVSVADGFGYTSSASYDLRFGLATTETDTNGAQIVRTYDGFGRLTTVRGPYDSVSSPALTLQYFPKEGLPRAVTTTRTSAPADYSGPLPPPITTVTIVDGLGRPIELRKTAVVDGVPGMTTSGVVQRDNLGRVRRSWHPFFTTGASTAFITPSPTLSTSTDYDELDRPTLTTHPDGAVEKTSYSIAIAPYPNSPLMFRTQHRIPMQPSDRVREEYTDHLGRVRAYVEHPTANSSSVTTYDYNATGELRFIIDAEGNQTTIAYDWRGLRTSLDNPDTGLREESYDLMGNRTALIEPNHRALGTQVNYIYERNRLAKIDYPSKPDAKYEYGAPGASNARAGRLARVSDETGSLEYFYGALGETRRTLRTFQPSGNPQPLVFDHRFTFDSLGRQTQLRYPDGEVVTNSYDNGGQLAAVTGAGDGWQRTYATGLRYDVFGNRTRMELGEVVTTWSYEPTRVRLQRVLSTVQDAAATKIQDLNYVYDPASNPTQITNALAPLASGGGAMPGASSLTLSYDGVDRLKRVVGQAQLDATRMTSYDQSFDYTPSHNLQTKTRSHLIVDGGTTTAPPATNLNFTYQYVTRPHLPDVAGAVQLQYDPSGNPISRLDTSLGVQQTLFWDDDDRLVRLTSSNGTSQQNTYDASGLRVRRKTDGPTGGRTTIFASPYFDLEGEQASNSGGIKHIFAGELRVATVLGSYASTQDPALPATPGTAYFVHGDRLGSTSVVTDEDGEVHQSLEYFADGEAWIDRAPTTPVNKFLFNGKPFDPDTGFYDFGQRFYDPRTSLWLGVDDAFVSDPRLAVRAPVTLSVAAYVGNNPAANFDPDGRLCIPCVIGAFIAMEQTIGEPSQSTWELARNAALGASGGKLIASAPRIAFTAQNLVKARTGSALVGNAAGGSAAGIATTAGTDLIRREASSPKAYAMSAGVGAAAGAAAGWIGSKVAEALSVGDDAAAGVTAGLRSYGSEVARQTQTLPRFYSAHLTDNAGLLAQLDAQGVLHLVIQKGPGTPSGGAMFNEAMNVYAGRVHKIQGTWVGRGELADNFNSFKSAIANGSTPERAAFQTFTGKMARRHGYTNAKILTNTDTKVEVEFSK